MWKLKWVILKTQSVAFFYPESLFIQKHETVCDLFVHANKHTHTHSLHAVVHETTSSHSQGCNIVETSTKKLFVYEFSLSLLSVVCENTKKLTGTWTTYFQNMLNILLSHLQTGGGKQTNIKLYVFGFYFQSIGVAEGLSAHRASEMILEEKECI